MAPADIKSFTQRLYGIDLGTIRVALESAHKGDMTALEKGMSEVALSWGTAPEMVKEMQKSWFAPQLKEYGY